MNLIQKSKITVLCTLLSWVIYFAHAQPPSQGANFSYNREIKLKKVTYSGTNLTLVKDDISDIDYTPSWNSDDGKSNPISYSSGSKLSITAEFELSCNGLNLDKIRLQPYFVGTEDIPVMKFKAKKPTCTSPNCSDRSGGKYILEYTAESPVAFTSKKICYAENFGLKWKVSFDGGGIQEDIPNISSNELYVTWKKPHEDDQYKYFHSLFHLTCKRFNGVIVQDENELIGLIWKLFKKDVWTNNANPNLYRKSDAKLFKYYEFPYNTAGTTSELLKDVGGQCGSFASLFRNMLQIHGKSLGFQNKVSVEANPTIITAAGYRYVNICGQDRNIDDVHFMIKNWQFNGPTPPPNNNAPSCSTMPYRLATTFNTANSNNKLGGSYQVGSLYYHYTFLDVKDQIGITGQNSFNPNSWFWNHVIVKIGNTFMTPLMA